MLAAYTLWYTQNRAPFEMHNESRLLTGTKLGIEYANNRAWNGCRGARRRQQNNISDVMGLSINLST